MALYIGKWGKVVFSSQKEIEVLAWIQTRPGAFMDVYIV